MTKKKIKNNKFFDIIRTIIVIINVSIITAGTVVLFVRMIEALLNL